MCVRSRRRWAMASDVHGSVSSCPPSVLSLHTINRSSFLALVFTDIFRLFLLLSHPLSSFWYCWYRTVPGIFSSSLFFKKIWLSLKNRLLCQHLYKIGWKKQFFFLSFYNTNSKILWQFHSDLHNYNKYNLRLLDFLVFVFICFLLFCFYSGSRLVPFLTVSLQISCWDWFSIPNLSVYY